MQESVNSGNELVFFSNIMKRSIKKEEEILINTLLLKTILFSGKKEIERERATSKRNQE